MTEYKIERFDSILNGEIGNIALPVIYIKTDQKSQNISTFLIKFEFFNLLIDFFYLLIVFIVVFFALLIKNWSNSINFICKKIKI